MYFATVSTCSTSAVREILNSKIVKLIKSDSKAITQVTRVMTVILFLIEILRNNLTITALKLQLITELANFRSCELIFRRDCLAFLTEISK